MSAAQKALQPRSRRLFFNPKGLKIVRMWPQQLQILERSVARSIEHIDWLVKLSTFYEISELCRWQRFAESTLRCLDEENARHGASCK